MLFFKKEIPVHTILVFVILTTTLVAGVVAYGFLQQEKYAEIAKKDVYKTQETMQELHIISSKLKSAVLAHHRYLLTGDVYYLKEYESLVSRELNKKNKIHHHILKTSIEDDLEKIIVLTEGEGIQNKRARELQKELHAIWNTLDDITVLFRTEGLDKAITKLQAYFKTQVIPTRNLIVALMSQENFDIEFYRGLREKNIQQIRVFVLSVLGLFFVIQTLLILFVYGQWKELKEKEIENRKRAVEIIEANVSLQDANAELARLNKQIRESSEAQMGAIINNALDGLVVMNSDAIVLRFNPASEEMFGYKSEEIIGKRIDILLPEPYATESLRHIKEHVEQDTCNGMKHEHESFGRKKDGSLFSMDLSMSVFELGGALHFAWVLKDITERKKTESELRRYMAELEKSNKDLDDFAYIASHDLKEPLRGLYNHSQFLIEDFADKLGEEGKKRLGRLAILSERMERLVSDLLYFSRLGRAEMAVQSTDLNQAILDILHMVEDYIKDNNAKILIPTPLPIVQCDKTRITEALRNLVMNAIKYNDNEEKLVEIGFLPSISAPHGEEKDVFYVKDNGIGIDPQYFVEIFRIFKRLQRAKEDDQSTGSGLTFVKKIIERHRGHIWLESEKGKGTTFYFTLGKMEAPYDTKQQKPGSTHSSR